MGSNIVFQCSYGPRQNEEVQAIRNKYLPRPESRLDELKRLDRYVRNAGLAQALVVGTVGCALFGLGLCYALQVIGESVALGIFGSVWGMAFMIAAYPVYRICFRNAKEKYRPRILELSAELIGEGHCN